MKRNWSERITLVMFVAPILVLGWMGIEASTFWDRNLGGLPTVEAQSSNPGPPWSCSLDDIGATLTRCIVSAPPGQTFYITDIVAQSTTTTGGQWLLQTGTGTNCATGKVSLFPSSATVVRLGSPANTAAPAVFQFKTPIQVPENKDLCLLGKATDTTTIQISGYIGIK